MIYISFVAEKHERTINVYEHYKNYIETAFLLFQDNNPSYELKYNVISKLIAQNKTNCNGVRITLKDPDNFNEVYTVINAFVSNWNKKEWFCKSEKIINIRSGTRTMTTCLVLMAQAGIIKNAKLVQYIREGFDYAGKVFEEVELGSIPGFPTIQKIRDLENEINEFKNISDDPIVGKSPQILDLRKKIKLYAKYDSPVLILGPTGSGKELTAQGIHESSSRKTKGKYEIVNCGAIPKELVESELFGHKKGSYSGAYDDKVGIFESADKGTVFLDEVADLPLDAQVKILRTLSKGEIRPVGGAVKNVNVRILAATNKDILKLISEGNFREDLYYRLSVLKIEVTPLSERKEDIEMHTAIIMNEKNKKYSLRKTISEKAVDKLLKYHWPGNVRELENVIERAFVLSDKQNIISPEFINFDGISCRQNQESSSEEEHRLLLWDKTLGKFELNANKAAEYLGIKGHTFRQRLRSREIEDLENFPNIRKWLERK